MIVSIERRFLSLLAEKSEREQDELLATSQFRQAQTELARRRHEWGTERKKLVSIIQNVVTSAQVISLFYIGNSSSENMNSQSFL